MEWKKLRLIEEAIDTKKNDFIDFVPMKSIFFLSNLWRLYELSVIIYTVSS